MTEKAVSLHEIKKELNNLLPEQVAALCLRLAKYKKENKELLAYLLFEAQDEAGYIQKIKAGIDEQFAVMNKSNLHLTKKSVRKILRNTSKFIKYSGVPETGLDLLIYFCKKLKSSGIQLHKSVTLSNMYRMQLKKISKILEALHEDLQHDYRREVEQLNSGLMLA